MDSTSALFAHAGVGRAVVTAAKHGPPRPGRRWLAAGLAGLVTGPPPDVVTWVPASHRRIRRLGGDPGARLADLVAARVGGTARATLARGRDRPQTGRTGAERRTGPRLTATAPLPGLRVLIVDDVVTTGSSLRVAAAVLRAAGAAELTAVAVAHRPKARPAGDG